MPEDSAQTDAGAAMVDALLTAYRTGLFPMAEPQSGLIKWFSPDPRALLPIDAAPGSPGGLRMSRSLRAKLRRAPFLITTDRAFPQVLRACAAPRSGQDHDESWIDCRIIDAYDFLHNAGHAHSVEAWLPDTTGTQATLVGGLYGVHLGAVFFGESMFSRPDLGGTDASKVCLVHLVAHLRQRGFVLLDTQFSNPHMEQFGIIELPRKEYLRQLAVGIDRSCEWGPWTDQTTCAIAAES